MERITEALLIEIALKAAVSISTVRRVYAGTHGNANSRKRIEDAATELGAPSPPPRIEAK